MTKHNFFKIFTFALFIAFLLTGCRNEMEVATANAVNNTDKIHNKITFNSFKQETKVKKFLNVLSIQSISTTGKNSAFLNSFKIDTVNIYKLEVNNNFSTYAFRAYSLFESPDKVYNVVYRKNNDIIDYSIVEILPSNIIKPIYDSNLGVLTIETDGSASKLCTQSYSTVEWICKNGDPYELCDKCINCFQIFTYNVHYSCSGGSASGNQPPGTFPSNTPPVFTHPPANGIVEDPPVVFTDPSGYIFDPNMEPNIDANYVRASRAYSFWIQLDYNQQTYAASNPDVYQNLIENYLNNFSTSTNSTNLEFHNWGLNFLKQNPSIDWEKFTNLFVFGYSNNFKSKIIQLSQEELQEYIAINNEISTSSYEEEYIKETNEAFAAFTSYADVETMTDAQISYVLNNNCCAGMFFTQFTIEKTKLIGSNYLFNRKFYPEWSKSKCFWEASRETIQLMLDIGGLVPVIGEVCDITNGVIYTIQGDGLNASLSYASAIPVAGWFAAGSKFTVKVVNKTASNIASRQVLKWIVGTDGLIKFGYRKQLRKVLQLTDGTKHAHHIIPWEFANYAIVQKAAKSGEAFHMNDFINGIPLQTTAHLTGHSAYNARVGQKLIQLNAISNSPQSAYINLTNFANQIKSLIQNNPNMNLGQIATLIN